MARGFQRLVAELSKLIPEGRAEAHEQWGAQFPNHRSLIRESLRNNLPECEAKIILNLEAAPRPKEWSISISHARDFGGWMAVPRPRRIGFDVELMDRIRTDVITRISSANEKSRAPFPQALWVAKESLYKALEHEQPAAITQLIISHWRTGDGSLAYFEAGPAQGVVLLEPPYVFAFSVI